MSKKHEETDVELYCGYCGERLPEVSEGGSGCCPQCSRSFSKRRVTRRPPVPPIVLNRRYDDHWSAPKIKDPMLAALLSTVLPGAGQVYNNQFIKGFLVFATCVLVIPYFLGVFDAYLSAEQSNREWRTVAVGRYQH